MTEIPATMTAIDPDTSGGPETLQPVERPVPAAGPGDVLIRVAAAGVNRPDVLQRQGKYPPPPGAPSILGLEVAGEIVALGQGVDAALLGTNICALVAGGGYAEYCVAPAAQCLSVPNGLSLIEAAAIPETLYTVWTNVFQRGRAQTGENPVGARRDVRHRHDGHRAGQGVRIEGDRHGGQRGEMRAGARNRR